MQNFAGRTLFVTGAAGGIGLALARAFGAEGMDVAIADVDAARLDAGRAALADLGGAVSGYPLDVTDFAAWEAALDAAEAAHGPIALLVNNAGVGGGGNVAEDDPARWRRVLEVNALGPFHGCRAVLPRMLARGDEAHIVNVASLSGLRSNPGMSSYDASKFAVVGMCDALRLELAGTNVGLSVVYPGMTRTRFIENSGALLARETGAPVAAGIGDFLAQGMDPAMLAARVVRAVKAGEYHVFTHGDWKASIKAVFDDRLAAFGENADPDYHEDIAGLSTRIADTQSAG